MVPKHESQTEWRCQIARFCLNLRQVIASNRGKELIQVTLSSFFTTTTTLIIGVN
jgi:hypothetical protein